MIEIHIFMVSIVNLINLWISLIIRSFVFTKEITRLSTLYIYISGMIHCLSYTNLFQFIRFVLFILLRYIFVTMHNFKIESST